MTWSPAWPSGLDAYGSFPGQPYTDGSEYILAAYADSWVLTLATLEAYIGYGSEANSPIYSPVYAEDFGTMAARFVNVETQTKANTDAITNNPTGRIFSTEATTVNNTTITSLVLDSPDFLLDGFTQSGFNLIAPVSGYYQINAQCTMLGSAGTFEVQIFINGGGATSAQAPLTADGTAPCSSDILYVPEGGTIGVGVYQTSGGTILTYPSSQNSYLSATLVTRG